MSDAALPLQKLVVAQLKADAAVTALVAGRVYDAVPTSAPKPYIAIGPMQVLPDQADCYDGCDIALQLDAFSGNNAGSVECKKIGRAVRDALDGQTMVPLDEGQRLVVLVIEQTQYLIDPDGITHHAVIQFTARTEPV